MKQIYICQTALWNKNEQKGWILQMKDSCFEGPDWVNLGNNRADNLGFQAMHSLWFLSQFSASRLITYCIRLKRSIKWLKTQNKKLMIKLLLFPSAKKLVISIPFVILQPQRLRAIIIIISMYSTRELCFWHMYIG